MKKAVSIIVLLCLLLSMAACANLYAPISNQTPSSSTPTSTGAASEPEAETETEPPAQTEDDTALHVGDTVELEHWSVTLDNFELVTKIDGDYYSSFYPKDGSKYGVVSLTATNNGTTADTFLPSFSLGDDVRCLILSGEYEFSASNLLGHSDDMHDTTMNPLMSSSGIIAFEIPDSIAESEAPLLFAISCDDTYVSFALR